MSARLSLYEVDRWQVFTFNSSDGCWYCKAAWTSRKAAERYAAKLECSTAISIQHVLNYVECIWIEGGRRVGWV